MKELQPLHSSPRMGTRFVDSLGIAMLFFAFRGVLDNFSVYAYAPNDAAYRNLMAYARLVSDREDQGKLVLLRFTVAHAYRMTL
jgi:hypothetical protein